MNRLIDLHLHIDGSLSVPTLRTLARLGGQELPETDEQLWQRLYAGPRVTELNDYLDTFVYPLGFLQQAAQITASVRLLQDELAALGLAYAELRFSPQSQCSEGLTQEQVVQAALAGLHESPCSAQLILCCMRWPNNRDANLQTVELAAAYGGKGVCGVDLAGAEGLYPTIDFAYAFRRAEELGVPATIHAGEADGPRSVAAALEMGARRIGHGVRALEDPGVVREMAMRQVTVELCPTSELQTGAVADAEALPLRAFMEAGVPVTVNSDNMSVSGTDVARELDLAACTCGLGQDELVQLRQNAARAAFADAETKARLLREIDEDACSPLSCPRTAESRRGLSHD